MPLVRIDITGPKPAAYKRALLDGCRTAVVESLGVPDERVTIRIIETPAEDVSVPSCRTDRFTLVDVLMYEGRGEELKRAMYDAIRARFAEDPGIEPSEVNIAVRDVPRSDLDAPAGEAGR